jgi:hypothetical protein
MTTQTVDEEELLVHTWRVARLTQLGISRAVAEVEADRSSPTPAANAAAAAACPDGNEVVTGVRPGRRSGGTSPAGRGLRTRPLARTLLAVLAVCVRGLQARRRRSVYGTTARTTTAHRRTAANGHIRRLTRPACRPGGPGSG